MVAIAHRYADEYVQNPPRSHQLFLVYGSDAGLVRERSRALLQIDAGSASGSSETLSLSGDAIASDPNALLDEVHSLRLFDQVRSAIRISLGARNLIPVLELLLRSAPFEARIVVEAGPLKPTAPLRKWFESQATAVAIECYSDQPNDLRRLIVHQISSCGASIESDAIEVLAEILGEDRGVTRSEIEKLCLYTNGQRPVTLRDVADVLITPSSIDGSDIIMDAVLGNEHATIESLSAIATLSSEFNAISSKLLRHILALHAARAQVAAGLGRNVALQNFLRSLNAFQKMKEISAGLNLDTGADTVALVDRFYALVRETRHTSLLADTKLSYALIALARLSKMRQGRKTPSIL
jgi:DNA polymerase-3 subunit delta